MQQPKAKIQKQKIRNRFRKALFGEEPLSQNVEAGLKNNSIYLFDKNLNTIKRAKAPFKQNNASPLAQFASNRPSAFKASLSKERGRPSDFKPTVNPQNHGNRIYGQPKYAAQNRNFQNFSKKRSPDNHQFGLMGAPGVGRNPRHMRSYDYLLDNTDWLSMGLLDRNIDGYNDCLNGYYGLPNAYIPQQVSWSALTGSSGRTTGEPASIMKL